MPPRTVHVLGSSAIEVELLERALAAADDAADPEVDGPDGEGCVAVLVRPGPGEWTRVAALAPDRLVVVDDATSDDAVVDLVTRGADGVIDLREPIDRLVDAVADDGDAQLTDGQVKAVVAALRSARSPAAERDRLTERELQVLSCIDEGMSVKQTARALTISAKTVENLQSRLFRKLGARNRAQAVLIGHRIGLLGAEGDAPAPEHDRFAG